MLISEPVLYIKYNRTNPTMKFTALYFPLLLASTAAAATINDEFEEQVHQSKTELKLRGAMSDRSQEWLDANLVYINDSLKWAHALKQTATEYAKESASGDACEFPQITLDNTVHGQLVSVGMGTNMNTLPEIDQIFQGWEDSTNVDLATLANMKKVGCGDALNAASGGKMGCFVSVCLYSLRG